MDKKSKTALSKCENCGSERTVAATEYHVFGVIHKIISEKVMAFSKEEAVEKVWRNLEGSDCQTHELRAYED